ncbi:hypothetical protein ACF08N_17895 [Streptomyces sp. NPDC015127]|uniref:hypothetical protein n=1 Tax=Streptomyces sp. NPDC015127 TaxID=3364939 RepID=UPI0036FABD8F
MIEDDVGRLIAAAGGTERDMRNALRDVGAERAVRLLAEELVHRADLEDLPHAEAVVRFACHLGERTVNHLVHVSKGSARHIADAGESDGTAPDVTVRYDTLELVRAVFGPTSARTSSTRRVEWHTTDPIGPHSEVPRTAPLVQRLLRGTAPGLDDLAELSLRFGSDKWGLHFYTPLFERHFAPMRDRPLTLLELGIGGFDDPEAGGGSLRLWRRYFHRAVICGVDIAEKTVVAGGRIRSFRGSQTDPVFLDSVVERVGPPDIVIDDASHRCADVIASFRHLFPILRPGGLYVVEDLQTSYWPRYGGSSEELSSPATSMGFLKTLADAVNHEELNGPAPDTAGEFGPHVVGVHFYHNLAVIEKGANQEGTLPPWHPARAD